RNPTGIDAVAYAREVVKLGAGEILLTSMDRDGTRQGFDLALTRAVADAVPVPVIASGGVGKLDHFVEGIRDGHAAAVLAASVFHFGEYAVRQAKEYRAQAGLPVRLDPYSASPGWAGEMIWNPDGRTCVNGEFHDPRSGKARAGARRRERRGVLYPQTARSRRRPMRQEVRRGSRRGCDCGCQRRPRGPRSGGRRRHLPSLGAAARPRHFARRGRGRTRCAQPSVGSCGKGGAQKRLRQERLRQERLRQERLRQEPAIEEWQTAAAKEYSMEQRTQQDVSPYRVFSRAEWAMHREDTPMTLKPAEVSRLRSMHDRLDMSEVEGIYLPLSRLVS